MRGSALLGFGIILLVSSSLAFLASASESASSRAEITDISNASSMVSNLTLSEWAVDTSRSYIGGGNPSKWFDYQNIVIKKGETILTVDFDKINSINFNWSSQNGSAEVKTTNGDVIVGRPISHQSIGFDNWFLRGDTDYGRFKLGLNKTEVISLY